MLTEALQHQPLLALILLFGAGLLTSLNPCIYPMIPVTLAVITGNAAGQPSRGRVVWMALTYVLGLALFYSLLGLLAGLTGALFGTVASNPWVRLGVGALLLLFGLAMLDVFPVRLPVGLMTWAGRLSGGSYPAVFVLGATSGIVAAPCGAPAFAAVLTWVATTRSAVLGLVYLFVFSLGMSALLVAVGLFSGAAASLPRAGPWMLWIKKAGGVVLVVMAGYYFFQAWSVM
jgi:thiol:disulfide interchange protein DsbD